MSVGRFLPSALIILFWGAMTFFLIQRAYFPGWAAGAKVPVEVVLPAVFEDEAENHVMALYEGRRHLGNVNLFTRRMEKGAATLYQFRCGGFVESQSVQSEGGLRMRQVAVEFTPDGRVQGVSGEMYMPEKTGLRLNFGWSKATAGESEVTVSQGRDLLFDSRALMDLGAGGEGMGSQARGLLQAMGMDPSVLSVATDSGRQNEAVVWVAREARLKAAGQMRDGYTLTTPLIPGQEDVEMFVTRQGDIVRVTVGRRWELRSVEWYPE